MKRALPLLPDETQALLWAPWRMLESDHDSFRVELLELEGLLERYCSGQRCPSRILARMDRFIVNFQAHMRSHFRAEEEAVFPYLRRHAPTLSGTLRHLTAEHEDIRRAMAAWKRIFRKTKAGARPPGVEDSLSAQGVELVCLLRTHVEKESRIMRQFPPKAV